MGKLQAAMNSMMPLAKKNRSPSAERTARSPSAERSARTVVAERRTAPHPIPAGLEGQPCPITGLFAEEADASQEVSKSAVAALAELEADPDIAEERKTLMLGISQTKKSLMPLEQYSEPTRIQFVPLNVSNGAHRANSETRRLIESIGGFPTLRRFTEIFYKKCFADPHIDQFLRRHDDPHGERFASWITEKFGDGARWTEERRTRPRDLMQMGHHVQEVAFDRSSAHFAAWHSPKRPAHKWGQRFEPDDARVWMRLHFWSAREAGLFEPQFAAFMDYYVRFIGHFISVYSGKSPPFTRESARWSANPRNIELYLASGNRMLDVIDKPVEKALAELPHDEREYTGSRDGSPSWPYELRPRR